MTGYMWSGLYKGRDLSCRLSENAMTKKMVAISAELEADVLYAHPVDSGRRVLRNVPINVCPWGTTSSMPVDFECHQVDFTDLTGNPIQETKSKISIFSDKEKNAIGVQFNTIGWNIGEYIVASIRYRCPNDTKGVYCPDARGAFYMYIVPSGKTFCYANPLSDLSMCEDSTEIRINPESFARNMIRIRERNVLQSMLFSRNPAQPPPDILELKYKYSSSVTHNYSIIHDYAAIPSEAMAWGIAKTSFFYQIDEKLMRLLSFSTIQIKKETLEIPLINPFCDGTRFESFITVFLYYAQRMADESADFQFEVESSGVESDSDSDTSNDDYGNDSEDDSAYFGEAKEGLSQGTSTDVICHAKDTVLSTGFGYTNDLKCCNRRGHCDSVSGMSDAIIFMILLLIVFCIGMGSYLTYMLYKKAALAGSVLTDVAALRRMTNREFRRRRRIVFALTTIAPFFLLYISLGLFWVYWDRGGPGWIGYTIISIFLSITLIWYSIAFHRAVLIFIRGQIPSRKCRILFHVCAVVLLGLSMYVLLLCFSWMVVGMLLNPIRVLSTMVMIVTIAVHVVYNTKRQNEMMDTIEVELRKRLLGWEGQQTESLVTLSSHHRRLLTPQVYGESLAKALSIINIEDELRQEFLRRIHQFGRYRIRYIFMNVFASTFFLFVAILFVYMAMSLFTQPGLLTSTVASGMIILAGVASNVRKESMEKARESRETQDEKHRQDRRRSDSAISTTSRRSDRAGEHEMRTRKGGDESRSPLLHSDHSPTYRSPPSPSASREQPGDAL
eukprot:TRINITY_DN7250_c0_g1_i2.p1 TRINITY_DN7250_c0_g1~~TRINITY_DN7250_c0_g1_i2.p1  ORF type:complete len:784 (-),score=116.90 TRINITY_DN7250_c0_g1_i2:115-2466(-)